jgi:hypothetical protein
VGGDAGIVGGGFVKFDPPNLTGPNFASDKCGGECHKVFKPSLRGALATKQSSLPQQSWIVSLRSQ